MIHIITAAICCNRSAGDVDGPARYMCATTNSRSTLSPSSSSNRSAGDGNLNITQPAINWRPSTNPCTRVGREGKTSSTSGLNSAITNADIASISPYVLRIIINRLCVRTTSPYSRACTNIRGSVSSFGINLPGKLLCDTNRSKISAISVDIGIHTNTISANTRTTANVRRSITAGGGQRPEPCNDQTTAADFRPTIIIPPCFYLNCRTAGTTFQRILILYNESHRCPGTSIVRMNGYCRIV